MINIEDLTLKNIKEILKSTFGSNTYDNSHWEVGKNYFIRTVKHHYTGKLKKVSGKELVLTGGVAWIAEDGRFNEVMKSNEFSEVEPYPDDVDVIIGRGAILDASIMKGKLPREVK